MTGYTIIMLQEIEGWFDQMELLDKNGKRIDLYDLFSKHPEFIYCQQFPNDFFCEATMLEDAIKNVKRNADLMFANIASVARLNMLTKLFQENKYTLENFNLEVEE